MRLWHEELIPLLPRQQLLGQHRECCAMRGNGWGKKHRVVDYVFKHSLHDLELYHAKVMQEMFNRGYNCLLYTSPSPRDRTRSRMPSSA